VQSNQFCAVQEAEYAIQNDNVRLILRKKIIKIVATRCQILKLKCTKFGFGSTPNPARGVLPDLLAGFKGLTSNGREGAGRKRVGEVEAKG